VRGARGAILLLGSLAAIGPLSGDTYLPAFPQIAADLGAPPVRVQLTLTASPFVVQDLHGASPGVFAVLFAVNAAGLAVATQVNARMVGRVEPERLLSAGLAVHAAGGVSLLGVVTTAGGLGVLLRVLVPRAALTRR
jgi:MFS family permease